MRAATAKRLEEAAVRHAAEREALEAQLAEARRQLALRDEATAAEVLVLSHRLEHVQEELAHAQRAGKKNNNNKKKNGGGKAAAAEEEEEEGEVDRGYDHDHDGRLVRTLQSQIEMLTDETQK